jgi:response regulator RpfG family c-di-GMP phosphodiesterase
MNLQTEGDVPRGYVLVVGAPGPDRDALAQIMRDAAMEVAVASEGDVLVTTDLVPPRLLVLDDTGNREERHATLRRITSHRQLVGVPVLILASQGDIESYSSAITKGAAAYLVKPVSIPQLVDIAQKLSGWVGITDRTEKRFRMRRPLIMRIDLDVRSQKLKLTGHLMDVSGGGCRIEVPEPVAPGEAIRIILHGYDALTHVVLAGEVRWQREVARGVHLLGCRFTGTSTLLAGKLLGFVSSGTT